MLLNATGSPSPTKIDGSCIILTAPGGGVNITRNGPPKQKNHPRMGVIFEKVAESLLLVLDRSLCCHRYIAPIISYPHAHIQVRPLVDSPAGRKAVDILLCIVDRQRKSADFDVVIRVKFALCIVSGSQIPTELIL